MSDEEEWMEKHQDTEGEGKIKAMDTNTGDTRANPYSLETHRVRKWRDIGHQRAVGPRIYQIKSDR